MGPFEGIWERNEAGSINPRLLVEAQKKLAVKNGCRIVNDVVKSVAKNGSSYSIK